MKREENSLKPEGVYYEQSGITVRRAILKDIDSLSKKLRKSDIEEIWASHNFSAQQALKEGVEKSIWCASIVNGDVIGMFGINPESITGKKAVVWLLASDDLYKIKTRFLKNGKKFINYMLDFYPYLHNYIDCRNDKTIKWLEWLGAKLETPKSYGKEGKLFQYFYFRR